MHWLRRLDDKKAQCSVCKTSDSLLSKKSVIDVHAKGDKHKRLMKEKLDSKVTRMTSFVKNEGVDTSINRAEIKLAAWAAEHEISFRAMDHLPAVLASSFNDSKTANGNAETLFNTLENELNASDLKLQNCVGWSADTCSVMHGKHNSSSSPMIHLLHDSISKLYLDILSCYVKPAYLKQSQHDLSLIDPDSELAMVPLENVYVGTNVGRFLTTTTPTVTVEAKREFLHVCRKFLVTACMQLKQRFNFHDPVLVAASKLNVATVMSGNIASFVGNIMIHFPGILDHGKEQEVDNQWRKLPYDDNLTDDMEFDVFWQADMQDTRYSALNFCIKAILTIPVANADCERIFSGVHRLKSAVRNRLTSSSLLKYVAAREGIRSDSENCEKFEPDKVMLQKYN
ncbi:hypothetical protein Pmani_004562 [Petrolisthes manimaculis]|uniref:HAT C-terminal dimerisation domain-containing protein n=1 Tax=Petrolisthes manimaculis TaxID=1843537 RepID=A0AAE1QEG4_9EUCA|nr:hypothetical protein Pmani_004562 [Petrolisthes manimaculis]